MTNAGYSKFSWNEYIDLAEDLLLSIPTDSDDEAKDRCGISRAYYAAFHQAEKFLKENVGQTIRIYQKGSHNEVIKTFEDFGHSNEKYVFVSEELKLLKKQRERADYAERFFLSAKPSIKLKKQLEKEIARARKIIETIDELKKI